MSEKKQTKTVLITGGCGFIGHHFVEHILISTNWNVIVVDKLTYASHALERLRDTDAFGYGDKRFRVFTYDLSTPLSVGLKREFGEVNYIVHMAADTHVDNSISDPVPFIQNNVMSTVHLLEYARELKSLEIFFYFSTDEVYGPALNDTLFNEDDRHNPTNPYSASKSAAEQICVSYHNTYDVPVMRINVMNAFGERQHVEKFIPKVIKKVLSNEEVEIHSYPNCEKSGTRFYIHGRNIAAGVLFLLSNGKIGESYNLTGEKEVSNLEMAQFIANTMGHTLKYKMVDFHSDRPGHDLRYGLNDSKMKKMGWKLPINFEDSLRKTILWTMDNQRWLNENL
jgi:dTDP-glucose 4,6-dehydratase